MQKPLIRLSLSKQKQSQAWLWWGGPHLGLLFLGLKSHTHRTDLPRHLQCSRDGGPSFQTLQSSDIHIKLLWSSRHCLFSKPLFPLFCLANKIHSLLSPPPQKKPHKTTPPKNTPKQLKEELRHFSLVIGSGKKPFFS